MNSDDDRWLAAFHAGERTALEECYREHAPKVRAAAARMLGPVDAETVTHEVFYRLISTPSMRQSFKGGDVGAWLVQVVTHSAIDDLRKRKREASFDEGHEPVATPADDDEVDAKVLIERFRREKLPAELAPVFEARFLRQLPQREAAKELAIPRTTLVYQEQKIRVLLQRFLLNDGDHAP